MPRWQNEPPAADRLFANRIVRTPADKSLAGICTSPHPTGTMTHYANGRTQPCEGQGSCDLCAAGHSARWHGYIGLLIVGTMEHVIFEYTAPANDVLKRYYEQHDSLRGCGIIAHRPSRTPNGRVVLRTQPTDLLKWKLPEAPELMTILCHIWGVATGEAALDNHGKVPADTVAVARANGRDRRPRSTVR